MWLPKEGKFILLFSNKISESGISAWATTRGRPYEIIFMQPNNNLPVCFLLGHSGKPIPEPYLGIGVAMRPASRVPTVTYIETDIIIRKLSDTKKLLRGEQLFVVSQVRFDLF